MINVEIESTGQENSSNVLRKFSRKVKESGILRKARSLRYHARPESKFARKNKTLRGIKKREETEKMIKLGKLPENNRKRR